MRLALTASAPTGCVTTLTSDGLRLAVFYTKVHDRMLRPLMAGDQPQSQQPSPAN